MIHFLRHLTAAPVRLLLWLTGFLPVINRLILAQIIWTLTADVDDGCNVIILTANKKGLQPAREKAMEVLEKTHDASAAVSIGMVEAHGCFDPEAAYGWIQKARQLECKNLQKLLKLELLISNDITAVDLEQVIEQILSRNDLTGEYSQAALCAKAALCLMNRDWNSADALADRVLVIEELAWMRMVKWTTASATDDKVLASMQQLKIEKAATKADELFLLSLGKHFLGDIENAKADFKAAVKQGAQLSYEKMAFPGVKEFVYSMKAEFEGSD
ncbi:MAG: hypothetical protein KAJ07_07810 [Planctomycetes bacterium]|nr:hypothetical protein [Planctomycetota bacterium]